MLSTKITSILMDIEIPAEADISSITEDIQGMALELLVEKCLAQGNISQELLEQLDILIEKQDSLQNFEELLSKHINNYSSIEDKVIEEIKNHLSE